MAIKGNMDGLQVLKGGQGKATIYFSKDAMHGALDLNESAVEINPTSEHPAATGPTRLEILYGMQRYISEEIVREVNRNAKIDPLFAGKEETDEGDQTA